MVNNDPNNNGALIPSITGSPQLDTFIRYGILAAAAALTGVIVTWLNAHGFTDPNLAVLISGATVSFLSAIAVVVWGYLQNRKTQQAVVQHVVTAAITSTIPPAVKAAITPEQEVAITNALNTGQLKGA